MREESAIKNKYFLMYVTTTTLLLLFVSHKTLYEALSGKGYLYVASTESPAYIFTFLSFILKIFNKPLVAEVILYYFLLTLFSAITIYLFLTRIVKVIKPSANSRLECLSAAVGGLIYVFFPRMLIVDVGPSFLMLKALLPLLLLLGVNLVDAPSKKEFFKYSVMYSAILALGYLITYDPRLIIHSILLTEMLIISLTFTLKLKLKNALFKVLMSPLILLLLTLLFSAPRVYNDVFMRTLPIGSGIAYVKGAFLYTWSTYLTAFLSMPAFLYPFYKLKLGFLRGLLVIPSLIIGSLLILSTINTRKERSILRFLLIMLGFFIVLIALFCSPSFPATPSIVKIAFNSFIFKLENIIPLIKYFFLLFRAPRFIDDFIHILSSITISLFLVFTLAIGKRKSLRRKLLSAISLILVIMIIISWITPIGGRALIFNIKAIDEAKYYDEFLESIHGDVSTSLKIMIYHGSKPGGYLIKYIYPVKPYWRADGTIANFIYEYLREKIYSKDLFAVRAILCLYGFKYLIVNTINGPDRAVRILNSTTYFSFLRKIGPFYIFKVKACNIRNIVSLTDYVLVVGGLETYMELLKNITSRVNITFIPFVPIFDDSWNYDINYVLKNAKAIVFMSRKSLIDLLFSYIMLNKEYDILLIPSRYAYNYDPLHQWSPAYSTYAFHGVFPYFDWFPAPYTWEYGYNPHYGFIWTKARGANISIKFHIDKDDDYVFLIRHLVTPQKGKILIKIDNKTYTLITQDASSKHSYLKVTELGPLHLCRGWHKLKMINLNGFNMINLILIVSRNKLIHYYNYLDNLIKNKLIIRVDIDHHLVNVNCTNCSRFNFIDKLLTTTSSMNYAKCNSGGIFYRYYICSINKAVKRYNILVLPELYGLMATKHKGVLNLPVMYVLQGFVNNSYGNFVVSDIRRMVTPYEWMMFFINIIVLIVLFDIRSLVLSAIRHMRKLKIK